MIPLSVPYGFVRLSKKAHNEEFQGGVVHMNHLSTFQKWEGPAGDLRGDKLEGLLLHGQPVATTRLKICLPTGKVIDLDGTHLSRPLTLTSCVGNVFCMTMLDEVNSKVVGDVEEVFRKQHPNATSGGYPTDIPVEFELDPRMSEFGDSCVNITQPWVFIEQALAACERDLQAGLLEDYQWGPVKYFDPLIMDGSGFSHAFMKRDLFAHQNEWRLVVYPTDKTLQPYRLQMGPIAHISQFIPWDGLFGPI